MADSEKDADERKHSTKPKVKQGAADAKIS
jgi:hypothetical protein